MQNLKTVIELAEKGNYLDKVWNQKNKFVVLISLIISQGPCSFKRSREIRSKLFSKIGNDFTREEFEKNGLPYIRSFLSRRKQELLTQITSAPQWATLAGIGPWTRKAHEIMCGTDQHISLTEDSYIRKRMKGIITWSQIPDGWQTRVSRLFWRLTEAGSDYLRNISVPITLLPEYFV